MVIRSHDEWIAQDSDRLIERYEDFARYVSEGIRNEDQDLPFFYECNICGQIYRNEAARDRHIAIHLASHHSNPRVRNQRLPPVRIPGTRHSQRIRQQRRRQ